MAVNSLTLSWVASTAGTPPITYQPMFRLTGSTTFLPFGPPISGLSVVVTGLSAGTSYDFDVVAINLAGRATSAIATGTTTPSSGTAPSAPGNLVVTQTPDTTVPPSTPFITLSAPTATTMVLSWSAVTGTTPITYQPAFKLHTATTFANFGGAIAGTSVTVGGLTANTNYDFMVTAANLGGSAASTIVTGSTAPPAVVPSPNDTVITAVGPAITDAAGNLWTIVATGGTTGNQVAFNGVVVGFTANVIEIAYVNNVVWQENIAGNWYSFVVTGGVVSTGLGPTTSPLPAPATFADEFTALPLHLSWQTGDNWQLIAPDTSQTLGRGGPTWGEVGSQWWVNPFNSNTPINGIYVQSGSLLNLLLLPTPSAYAAYINSHAGATMPFVGALLNSSQTNYQHFGYWEISVAVDRVPGVEFQIDTENVQITGHWPPEVDILIYTDAANVQHLHFKVALPAGGTGSYTASSASGFDYTVQHVYGFNWQTDFITFYVDNVQVYQTPNPGGVYQTDKQFIYLVTYANNESGVNPNPASLPAGAHIDYLHVFQAKP